MQATQHSGDSGIDNIEAEVVEDKVYTEPVLVACQDICCSHLAGASERQSEIEQCYRLSSSNLDIW